MVCFTALFYHFSQVQQLRPGIDAMTEYILPIPEGELLRNSAIGQNPGYLGVN